MGWLIFIIAACIVEGFFAWQSFGGTHPFPLNEFGFQIFDHVLRDSVLAEIAYCITGVSVCRTDCSAIFPLLLSVFFIWAKPFLW